MVASSSISARLCPTCSAWLCAADDAFCGECGRPCAQLLLQAFPSVLTIGQRPPKVGLRFTNTTCAPLSIRKTLSPDWFAVNLPVGELVPPGGSKQVLVTAGTFELKEPESREVVIRTSVGEASLLLMVIQEQPAFITEPVIDYWPDKRSSTRDWKIAFAPPQGKIQVVRLLEPLEPWLSVSSSLQTPAVVSSETPFPLSLHFDSILARDLFSGHTQMGAVKALKATIPLEYEGPHGITQAPLHIKIEVRKPPALAWNGEHAPPRIKHQTRGQVLDFQFSNSTHNDPAGGRQNAALAIEGATLASTSEGSSAVFQLQSLLPVSIPGGDSRTISFLCDFQTEVSGIRHFTLRVATNRQNDAHLFKVPVDIRVIEPFDGVVAIDFGTSNTCCALLPHGGEFEIVALDDKQTTAPTLVRYLDLSGPEPEIETGKAVKHLAAEDEKVASSTLTRLKQQLGEAARPLAVRPANSTDWTTREATDAAADYLKHIRMIAEHFKGNTFQDFILTHPAVCSLVQYRNIRFALNLAFGQGSRVHFIQEPIASLIPFLHKNGMFSEYTVAAFDLGGGTTDITVVRVTQTRAQTVLEIRPEIVASWGERFGGEDITDFLVEELRVRCTALLAEEMDDYQIAKPGVKGASTAAIRRNESALREWAEDFKASLSSEASRPKPSNTLLLTVVPESPDQMPEEHNFQIEEFLHGGELRSVLIGFVTGHIRRLAARLKDLASAVPKLDFIQLSGKTAYLDVVDSVMRSEFPKSSIERATEPKECVVRGACLSKALNRGQNRRLILPSSSQRTTSQIGIVDEEDVFRPLIQLDREIPQAGLVVDVPNFWNGQDAVLLWENLGTNNRRTLADGSRNVLITKLGFWEPVEVPLGIYQQQSLRLVLDRDFNLTVSSGAGLDLVRFRHRVLQGAKS